MPRPLLSLMARRPALVVLMTAVGLLATPGLAAQGPAESPAVPRTDCEQAHAMPAEADEDSRRIACEIPTKYQQDVSMAEFIGRTIRMHDVAAWLTTDALVEKGVFKRVEGEGRGWLTTAKDNRIEVRYFREHRGRVEAFATAALDVASMKALDARTLSPAEPATERELRLMKARNTALKTPDLSVCTNHAPNTVVFEFDEDGREEILVFIMSAWKSNREAPLGGFHMFRYSADGETLQSQYSQTRSCPLADLDEKLPGNAEAASLAVTHLTSATPTMFHVFMNLQYRQPLYVITTQNALHWRVEQGRIHLVQRDGASDATSTDETGGASQADSESSTP